MDGKKTEVKTGFKKIFKSYVGMYFEDIPKTKKEISDRIPALAKRAGIILLKTASGYLFGSVPLAYSAIPMGTALLCSAKKDVFFVLLGLLISAVNEKTGLALPLFLIYTALYLARILVYRKAGMPENTFSVFGESRKVRLIEGFSAALMISAYRAASFGFLYYDLIGGVLEIIAVPVFIVLYDFAVDDKYRFDIKREIGLVSVFCSVVFALSGTYVFGFSAGTFAVCLITLFISFKEGTLRGGIYGLLCGMVCSVTTSPVFAAMGIVAGLFRKKGSGAALSLSCMTGILCGIYVEGWQSLTLRAPEIMCSVLAFFPFAHFGKLPALRLGSDVSSSEKEGASSRILAEKRQVDTEKKFEDLSNAFSELSEVFYLLSDRMRRPGMVDAREICDEVCDVYCPQCVFKRVCWERECSSTQDVFSKIAKELFRSGHVEEDAVEDFFRQRCRNVGRMLDRINDKHAELLENMIKQNKTEIFAMDYEAMAHLLEYAVKSNGDEYVPDEKTETKLAEAARSLKLFTKNVCVFGKRKKTVILNGIEPGNAKISAKEIKTCFENICGMKLTEPEFKVDGDSISMTLRSARSYSVEYAAAGEKKKNETFSGDLICMFENGHDFFYSLISDGMGSGREAALTSRLCGVFLKKMLLAGNSKPVAMEMLNNFIRSKNTECFSTVDLLEIDLLRGRAEFIKSGAVASYVLRGDKIFRIASTTMPVGITREINAEEVVFELEDGDVIVMVSDGVGQSSEDAARVGDLLTYSWEDDLQKMADKILKSAVGGCARSDDVSVGLIRVKSIA